MQQHAATHKITLLSELEQEHIDQAFVVFVEGFYPTLAKTLSKDKAVLRDIFSACFDHSMVYAFLQEDRVVGFLSLGTHAKKSIEPKVEAMQKHFGRQRGKIVAWGFGLANKILACGEEEASIDYLAVDPDTRGQGVASRMFRHLFETLPYRSYVLETQTINTNARRLYEKLGFRLVPGKHHAWYVVLFSRLFGEGAPLKYRLEL